MEKFCKYCGNKVKEDSKFCNKCGKNIEENENVKIPDAVIESTTSDNTNDKQNEYNNMTSRTNPMAIASFVCSLVGILLFGLILGTVAIVLSVYAKKHMKIFENEKGEGFATAGLVIGIVDVVLYSLWIIFACAACNLYMLF